MKKKYKVIIISMVLVAMGFVYINETNKRDLDADIHDHTVSQLNVLSEAFEEDVPILIEFVTHS